MASRAALLSPPHFGAIFLRDARGSLPAAARGTKKRLFPVRYVLTIIAVVLVAALTTALVAPLFVDWSAHRAEIEARLGAMTGADVSLKGPIALRLLPTPYLTLGQGSLSGRGADAPKLAFASARLELALVKLVGGAIRFTEIRLDEPVLTIARDAGGALRLPAPPGGRVSSIGFDRLVVHEGRVLISANGAAARDIAGVEIDASAPQLDGPSQVSGQFSGPNGAPVIFRLSSEKPGDAGTPIRASVDAGVGWPAIEFDGALENPNTAAAKRPRLSGTATLIGAAAGEDGPMPWRAVGNMTADLDSATIRDAEFRLGSDERALSANGFAALTYGSPARLSISLKAKQANVDALLRRKGEGGVAPSRALAVLSGAVGQALEWRAGAASIDADVSAESVILAAQPLSATLAMRSTPGAPLGVRFDLGLPGRSRLSGNGDFETGAAAKFRGGVDFRSDDFALLRDWASLGAPDAATKLAPLSEAFAYRSGSLSGDIEASAIGFSGRNLKLTLDRSTLTGSLAFSGPVGNDPGRLYLDLASDSLDVDTLPNLSAGAKVVGDLDLSLSLQAGSLHIARVGEAQIDSGSLALKVTKSGPNITLDRLSVAGLDGVLVDAQGAMGRDGTVATGHLRADRLHDFAALISRLAPGDWSRILVERAAALSPASLAFDARGGAVSAEAPVFNSVKANGTVGQTQITLSLDPGPKNDGEVLTLGLTAPDSSGLLRQFGLRGATIASGRGQIALRASGAWGSGYDVDGSGALAGADLTWRGRFLPVANGDDARAFGSIKLKTANVIPLIAALGLAPAGGVIGPADAAAEVTLRGDRWTVSRLTTTVAGVKASGNFNYQPTAKQEVPAIAGSEVAQAENAVGAGSSEHEPPPAAITGELSVDRISLGNLLALALGPPQPGRSGARWSDAKFGPAPFNPLAATIQLKVGTLQATDALAARGFATTLRTDKGRLDLDDMAMDIAGGVASGHATLRRDGETATLTGALNVDSIAVDSPGFSGRVGGTMDFASTGRSPAALVDGLAGGGSARFADAALARSDPAALDRIVARAQAPDAPLDETNLAFALGNELGKAPLMLPNGSTPIALVAGVAKLGPIAVGGPRASASLSADLDLRTLAVGTRVAFASSAADLKFWSGPPPNATVEIENLLGALERQLGVSSLSAGLAAQSIARESDRIATLEADIRERAFFNRRLKGERFLDRREQEVEDWQVEQARLKGLAEHLRDQAEAEKAAAEKAAAEKAAAEKAAAEKAAAERAAAAKALAEKAAAEKAAAERAAAERAAIEKDDQRSPETGSAPLPKPSAEELGVKAPAALPIPPPRPKPRPAPVDPTQGGLY